MIIDLNKFKNKILPFKVLNNSDLLNNIQIPDPFFGQTNLEQSLADLPSINSSSYNCIEQSQTQKISAVVEQNHYAVGMKAENHLPVLQKNNHQTSPVILQILPVKRQQ